MTIPMPEPVAWVRRHPDGALTAEFIENAVISPVRKQSGEWLQMITTTQVEDYADARVREVLDDVENELMDMIIEARTSSVSKEEDVHGWNSRCAEREIALSRALLSIRELVKHNSLRGCESEGDHT